MRGWQFHETSCPGTGAHRPGFFRRTQTLQCDPHGQASWRVKRLYQICTATLLLCFVGAVAAKPTSNSSACPDLSSLQSAAVVVSDKNPEQIAADNLVAEAQAITRAMSDATVAKAISLYEKAIQIDPKNAPAHLLLARAHLSSQRYLSVKKKDAHARAWKHLAKGRELDPANIDGLYLLVDQVFLANLDYPCAKRIFETALRLQPNNAMTHYWYSELLAGIGEFDRAFEHTDKALALANPDTRDYLLRNTGRQRYMAGQYDWVLQHYETYLAAKPNSSLAHFYRSLAYGAKGEFDAALVEAKKAQPDAPKGDAGGIAMLALAYANAGQKDKARELLEELLNRDARGEHVVEYRIAAVYEVLGERDLALLWLDKEIDDRSGLFSWMVWLKHEPVWKSMRQDHRFKAVLQRAGW